MSGIIFQSSSRFLEASRRKISSYRFSNCSQQQNYALLLWLWEILSSFWCCRFRNILVGLWLEMLLMRKHFLYLLCAWTPLIYLYIHSVQRLTVAIISENRLGSSKGLAHVYRLILFCHEISCGHCDQTLNRRARKILILFSTCSPERKAAALDLHCTSEEELFLFSIMSKMIINNETILGFGPYLFLILGYLSKLPKAIFHYMVPLGFLIKNDLKQIQVF